MNAFSATIRRVRELCAENGAEGVEVGIAGADMTGNDGYAHLLLTTATGERYIARYDRPVEELDWRRVHDDMPVTPVLPLHLVTGFELVQVKSELILQATRLLAFLGSYEDEVLTALEEVDSGGRISLVDQFLDLVGRVDVELSRVQIYADAAFAAAPG